MKSLLFKVVLMVSMFLMAACTHAPYSDNDSFNNDNFSWNDAETDGRSIASSSGEKCAKRIRSSCEISNNDYGRISNNAQTCKRLESSSRATTLEVLLLDKSDKLIVVYTKGNGVNNRRCPTVKYEIDSSGIDEVKVVGNKLFMRSRDGQVYFMYADSTFYELLNSDYRSYRATEILGSQDGKTVTIRFAGNGELTLKNSDIQNKIRAGKVRELSFYKTTTDRSIFRDE